MTDADRDQRGGQGVIEASTTPTSSSAAAEPETWQHARRRSEDAAADPSPTRPRMTPRLAAQIQAYRNTRYHEDRYSFFEAVSRWSNFLTIVLGSGAAATAISTHPQIAVGAGAATAVLGAAQLVFDFSGKSRTHLELRKTFARLMADAQRPDADPEILQARIADAYEGEPEVYHAVNALAHNSAQMAFDRGVGTTVFVAKW